MLNIKTGKGKEPAVSVLLRRRDSYGSPKNQGLDNLFSPTSKPFDFSIFPNVKTMYLIPDVKKKIHTHIPVLGGMHSAAVLAPTQTVYHILNWLPPKHTEGHMMLLSLYVSSYFKR